MQPSNSIFVKTVIPVWENFIKSLIFRMAELLLAFATWKAFSLLAATQNRFTSYLVFTEAPIQKAHFIWSRGMSKDALLVGSFSILYAASQLYGTLLWALDAPGHVVQTHLTPASSISASILDNPGYVVTYTVSPDALDITDADLAAALSANLFQRDANITLTASFDQGVPDPAPTPPRPSAGPRIWLDDKGWSISTDTGFHTGYHFGASDALDRLFSCEYADIDQPTLMQGYDSMRYYNCTFDNEWTPDLIDKPVGTPNVYWSEAAESEYIVGTIPPAKHDPWAYAGVSSGTDVRLHMFTVTKGYRRHTLLSTVAKASVVARANQFVPQGEMESLMRRMTPTDPAVDREEEEQGFHLIAETLMAAQTNNKSAALGVVQADKQHILEAFFEFLSFDIVPGETAASLFRITSVNITLLKSETISTPPTPFEPCSNAWANRALGGKVKSTSCSGGDHRHDGPTEFGQADTSAVLHLDGFDRPPYASTDEAMNPLLWTWVSQNTDKLTKLLLSRGYILGLDPKLVTVQLAAAIPGISYLQVFMVVLAAVLAIISWAGLWIFASGYWASSFLASLLTVTGAGSSSKNDVPIVCKYPDIQLEGEISDGSMRLRTDTGTFALLDANNPKAHG
ncbi:hypothetical protein OQA88_8972 [Cercophora sp. LCS_1]